MRTDDFAYHLPPERIAQQPLIPRDACRLLVLDRATGAVSHRAFLDIADYLHLGDLLVVNETRVLPARLQGRRCDTGSAVEVLLLKELSVSGATYTWECLVKPGKRVRTGAALVFSQNDSDKPALYATVVSAREEGIRHLAFTPGDDTTFADALHMLGFVPLP
ncbi:MAG: S-adenosylmethionine:tRNA ribosyltransferase-isomerase, partial [Actinomycetes bacterium]|nr:S-adenosylmethionine:tRNA ribosyltransferase-isomerase [Actinomycetes bacterium]